MLPGIVLAGASLALWRRSVSERLRMWLPALQGLGQGSLLVGGGVAAASFSPSTAAWTWGGLLAVEAGIVGAGAPLVPEDLRPRDASALLAAGAVLSAAGGVTQGPEQVAAVQTAAGLGALALFVVAPVERELPAWRMAPWVFGIVAVAGAVVLAAAALGPGDGGTVGTLAIGGAGLVAGGLGSGRWPAAYVGMLMLLVAGLVAGHDLLGGNRHLYAGAIAVVLLIILEMERIRMSRIDHPDAALRLDQTRVVELIVLAGPLALAALDSFGDPAFAGLLAGEAVIVLLWAIASRVKRRLVVGALGLVAAILIPAGVLAVEAASGGISSRAVLGIGALVAVALIAIGSMLERGRARVGRVVQRMSEILEDWE
jgi:hypothetical protein